MGEARRYMELPPAARGASDGRALVRGCGAGCDVDVVLDADLTAAAFRDRYVRNARPVLVRGAALSWPARSAARRDALVQGRTRERHAQLQRLLSRPFSTRFG